VDEAEIWAEIAHVRFRAAQGYDLQSDVRKEAAYRPRAPGDAARPGDELDLAGDEKNLAYEEYQRAAKSWEKAAQGFKSAVALDKAKSAKESSTTAWHAARQALLEAIELYRMAEESYEAGNDLPKKTAVLGKIAKILEQLIEIRIHIPWNSVSKSNPALAGYGAA
jgi:hypothetical protein